MLCSLLYLYPGNTQVLTVTGLQDSVTGNFLNDADVLATLFDEHGNPDPVLTDIILSYIPASNGTYQGTVPATFNASTGGGYVLKVTATQAAIVSLFTIPTQVRLRTE